tara:strand:- start:6113 stop:7360 length:1248 start_codon:yes stop_codon:yes gene_type:complete
MATTTTISREGQTRTIKITGTPNTMFEFYIKQGSNYYNFNTESFTSSISILKKQTIPAKGLYTVDVVIPTVTSNTKYDFFITPIGGAKLNIDTTADLKIGTLYQKGTATLTVTTTDDTTLNIASSLTGGTATTAGATVSQSGAITEASGNLVYLHSIPTWDALTGGAWTNTRKVTQAIVHGKGTVWHVEDGTNITTGLSVTGVGIIDEITVSAISGNKVTLSAAQNLKPGQELVFTPSQWEFSSIYAKANPNERQSGTTSITFANEVNVAKVGIADLTVELDVDEYVSIKPNAFPVNVNCPVGTAIEIDCKAECTNFFGTLGDLDQNTKTFKAQSIPAHATSSAAIRMADTSIIGTIGVAADEAFGSAGVGTVTYTPHAEMIPGDTDVFYYKTVDAQSSPQTSSLTQGKVTVTIV